MIAVGWVRLTGGEHGEYLIAFDVESLGDAARACPGVPLYRPAELAALAGLDADVVRAVAVIKRGCVGLDWGAVVAETRPLAAQLDAA